MKHIIVLLLLASASFTFASKESAEDIAKRVIADQSSAYTPLTISGTVSKLPVPKPADSQFELAAEKAREAIRSYMLSGDVPEKTRIAYAITVLAGKRMPEPFALGGYLDVEKNDQYLSDGLILAARLAEIQKAEQDAAMKGQP